MNTVYRIAGRDPHWRDAFEVTMEYSFDCVTISRETPRPYLGRIGFGAVSGLPTKRQRRLCARYGHPKHSGITRGSITTCARCRQEIR